MEEQLKRHPKRKIWVSIVAVTLSVLLVASIVLIDVASIKISADAGTDAQKAAAVALTGDNAYIGQDEMGRIGDVIASVLSSPQSLDDYYLLASMQIAQGRYEEALLSIEQCFREAPESDTSLLDDLWTKQGCLYAMLGDYDRTLESFDSISDGGSGSADITQIKAQINIERGDLSGAAQCIAAYLQTVPDDADMRALLAQVCYLLGDYTKAEQQYTLLLDGDKDEGGGYHLLRASCREQLGMYETALADYQQAKALGFEDAGLCEAQSALCCYQLGRYEDVLDFGEQAVKLGSGQAAWDMLYEAMGVSALQLAQYEQSAAYLTQALEKNEALADVYYYRGVAYLALERYEEAAADFTTSIARAEQVAQCCFNRALCELQAGQTDAAKADLETVLEISDDETLTASAQLLLSQWS